jgi:hypothetical protein
VVLFGITLPKSAMIRKLIRGKPGISQINEVIFYFFSFTF